MHAKHHRFAPDGAKSTIKKLLRMLVAVEKIVIAAV
jgi:hypothetical protein